MIRRVRKFIACLLIVLMLSSSVLANVVSSIDNCSDCDCAESYTDSDFRLESTSEFQRILNDLLATIPKDATIEEFQKTLSTKFPGVIVVKSDKVDYANDLVNSLNTFTEAEIGIIYSKVKTIADISSEHNFESYTIIWKDAEHNDFYVKSAKWCAGCGAFVMWLLDQTGSYIFDALAKRLETWLIERVTCAYNHLISETSTLVSVEYAPTCNICLSSNNMTWNGYWWCTLCNQAK
ncbi:MAG: hypothetical protein LLG09_00985 [Negativicutes bacterium]|nr:hypothetical protein [Negativicutes bacterium]